MNKKSSTIGLLVGMCFFIIFLICRTVAMPEPIENYTYGNTTVLVYPTEEIIIRQIDNTTFISSMQRVENIGDLVLYAENSIERFENLASLWPDKNTSAIITFKEALSESEVDRISKNYDADIAYVKFISTDGSGQIPYPPNHEMLARWESEIAEFEREYNNITDFVLVKGYTESKVVVPAGNLPELAADPDVLLVDVGPVELLEEYPNAIIMPGGENVFYNYNETVSVLPEVDETAPMVNITSPTILNYSYTVLVPIEFRALDDRDLYLDTVVKLDGVEYTKTQIDMGRIGIGTHSLTVEATDDSGNTASSSITFKVVDDVPPVTTDDTDKEWHTEDIVITLTPTDPVIRGNSSGVATTYYRINGGDTQTGTTVVINYEHNNNSLEYWSVDNAGNVEDHHFVDEIKLDKTHPITTDDYNGLWHNQDILITLTSMDSLVQGTPSGVAETYYVIYEDGMPQGTKSVSAEGQPLISYEDDDNWLEYWSVDVAGNEESHAIRKGITLDKTPPEAIISYDPNTDDIVVTGVDNFDRDVQVSYKDVCLKEMPSVQWRWWKWWEPRNVCMQKGRIYTLADDADNKLILTMEYKATANRPWFRDSVSSTDIRLLNAKYITAGKTVEVKYDFNMAFYNTREWSGKVKSFTEYIYMKPRGFVLAQYNSKKNETTILTSFKDQPKKMTVKGLKVIDMMTDVEEKLNVVWE